MDITRIRSNCEDSCSAEHLTLGKVPSRSEMEEVLRKELVAQAEKGIRLRQAVSFAIWLFTLVLGAWLGTYFKEVLPWAKALVA